MITYACRKTPFCSVASSGHEVVHEAAEIVHGIHSSETVDALDHFVGTAINAATNYLFGPSNGTSSGGSGH